MDRAGAYGIQDWIGYTGIEKLNGCYYNVMGLPLPKVYNGSLIIICYEKNYSNYLIPLFVNIHYRL